MTVKKKSFARYIKNVFIGAEVDLSDRSIFHRLSLVAFFAWVGLGADGLSSSCYGPLEAFAVLGEHRILALLVGLMTAVTVFVIAASYSQIIELFPNGGGGYFVASKLLSKRAGMFSGCALIIDYVLTIALSISSGADALLSMLPAWMAAWKVPIALAGVAVLTLMNLRGVKESIKLLIPVFAIFVLTHAFTIIYALAVHAMEAPVVMARLTADVSATQAQLGT
ncbi:MAG: amino acid permease, partial [Candidatus Adiutrix sp.]|nr:amino acid permease [Candidatus Adiutrix sp.]